MAPVRGLNVPDEEKAIARKLNRLAFDTRSTHCSGIPAAPGVEDEPRWRGADAVLLGVSKTV
jgi:hypothetical protein